MAAVILVSVVVVSLVAIAADLQAGAARRRAAGRRRFPLAHPDCPRLVLLVLLVRLARDPQIM